MTNLYRYVFAVGSKVYCCWEHDLPRRNDKFLSSIDCEYFRYIAQLHLDQIEGENKQRAAVALRSAYHHGLETFFSLVGALCQAPGAVPAWIPKCNNTVLRKLIKTLLDGGIVVTQSGKQTISLTDLSSIVHAYCWPNEAPDQAMANKFSKLWSRFASDFLDPHHIAEYNSIKHGFRVSSGGLVLRVGIEQEYGVSPPEENMQTVGASPFGTSFYEAISISPIESAKQHFRIRQIALNWRAEAMVQRLNLLACSINNVVGALRCLNGATPSTIKFIRPEDADAFEAAWNWSVGVTSSNIDILINVQEGSLVDETNLLTELLSRNQNEN